MSANARLLDAAQRGDDDAVQAALADGAGVNCLGDTESPMRLAASEGNVSTIALLAKRGANLDLANFLKQTPIFLAVLSGHIEAVKLLANLGANVNKADAFGRTPLINANDLKEDEEIRFEYDNNGNLKSVRKVRRPHGCGPTVVAILVIAGILWGAAQIFA